jgi:uncharacterized membrane protein
MEKPAFGLETGFISLATLTVSAPFLSIVFTFIPAKVPFSRINHGNLPAFSTSYTFLTKKSPKTFGSLKNTSYLCIVKGRTVKGRSQVQILYRSRG